MNAPADPGLAHGAPRLADLGAALARHVRDLATDYALLAVLDARRAAVRFGRVLAAALVAAVLLSTAWLAFVVAAVVALTDRGTSWAAALALAALVNVAAAASLGWWARSSLRELPFAATLRQLRGAPPDAGPDRHESDGAV
jgi:uncharacterized membrane protein YqjE